MIRRGHCPPSSGGSHPAKPSARSLLVTPTHLGFEEYDIATQIALSHHYWVNDE